MLAFSQQANVTVTINDLRTDDGYVLIQMKNTDEELVQQHKIKVENGKAEVTFEDVDHGKYAISYIHDENDNAELDTGFMGIPKEGYGFSNDARGFMGPPDFEDQMFELTSNVSMTLKTKYH